MSRQTPRKARHQHQLSAGGGGHRSHQDHFISRPDGASATASSLEKANANENSAEAEITSAHLNNGVETLNSMNLHVLQQYEPKIHSILAVASSTVVYVLNYDTGGWEKPEPQVEGTLFLCDMEPLIIGQSSLPRSCVFVLNRKGLMNVFVDLAKVNVAEVTNDLITLRIDDDGRGEDAATYKTPPVLGFWIHGRTAIEATQFDPTSVVDSWLKIRSALEITLGTAELAGTWPVLDAAETAAALEMAAIGADPIGKATRAIGRRPSVSELVATALVSSGGHGAGPIGT